MSSLWLDPEMEKTADKHKLVQDALDGILLQRPKLRLEFAEGVTNIADITASLLSHSVAGVRVELAALEGVSDKWAGAVVSCFFRLRDRGPQGAEHLLSFTSRVDAVHRQANGAVLLVLALPETIVRAQRRRSVRVEVDERKVPSLKVWPELATGARVAGKPPLLNSETDAKGGLKVHNISASGMALDLSETLMRSALPQQNKGERFSLHFTAVSNPGSPETAFWVNAALRNTTYRPQQSEVSLGFEFVAEGVLDEAKRIVWHPLKLGEVSGLGKFIFKWNLDNFREKPLHES